MLGASAGQLDIEGFGIKRNIPSADINRFVFLPGTMNRSANAAARDVNAIIKPPSK